MTAAKTPKFELLSPADAETERLIKEHLKGVTIAVSGHFRSRSLMRVYALIGGSHAERLMCLAPHGQGQKLLEQKFPDIARTKLHDWRNFAKKISEALPKSPTVGLLTAPKIGKKALSAKSLKDADEEINSVLGDQSFIDFARDKAPREAGGFRPNAEMLEAWLKANHPGLAGKGYDELPPEVQSAFKKQYRAPGLSPEEQADAERSWWNNLYAELGEKLQKKTYCHLNKSELEVMRDTLFDALENIKKLLAKTP